MKGVARAPSRYQTATTSSDLSPLSLFSAARAGPGTLNCGLNYRCCVRDRLKSWAIEDSRFVFETASSVRNLHLFSCNITDVNHAVKSRRGNSHSKDESVPLRRWSSP